MDKDASNLPTHLSLAEEKLEKGHRASPVLWTRPVFIPIPWITNRQLRLWIPNYTLKSQLRPSRLRRKRRQLFVALVCFVLAFTLLFITKELGRSNWRRDWHKSIIGEPSTLIFHRDHLQKIWQWEIDSGHYPSRAPIPPKLGFRERLINPAIPPQTMKPSYNATLKVERSGANVVGTGPQRVYPDVQSRPPNVAYPPRPVPGSVADMDKIMSHCDFSRNKYVRDCLEVLRIGGGLDNGQRYRRDDLDNWKYIYQEQPLSDSERSVPLAVPVDSRPQSKTALNPKDGLTKKKGAEWEKQLILPRPPIAANSPATVCDEENPRIFHMFWTGPFTDKPYAALLSFLYTQNTGLHLSEWPSDVGVCRPQFWMWINPGPAAAVPNPDAVQDMFNQLKNSPWAAPFLHPRFKDVIQFKMWNTTEQLDGIPEIKNEWRALQESLFNSGGHIISVKKHNATSDNDLLNRAGSKSPSSYDRLSVILSDMARFVLGHRFGGIYLDADTIFLRDWEELWGWKGAFAYRWSRLRKYNTAVLRMNKNSALGTFLFRTALKNGLDFHPMTVSKYTADAQLEGLLLRLPDALFDSAWLNTEDYQRDRPPQPYFTKFKDLFETPQQSSGSPQALGFKGFFRGAYSYHFHNFWWKPFDPARNWPDLGPRFKATEQVTHASLQKKKPLPGVGMTAPLQEIPPYPTTPGKDKRDLDWSTVLKRTFEAYLRGDAPNMYGEWLVWN